MNIKKYLIKLEEEQAMEELFEEEKEYCRQLANEHFVNNGSSTAAIKRNNKLWIALAGIFVIALALIITLPLVLRDNSFNGIDYRFENIYGRPCQIEEVNNNTKCFNVLQNDNLQLDLFLKYDSVSNDTLFYSVNVSTDISTFRLDIVVNEKFNYEFEVGEVVQNQQCVDYLITYSTERIGIDQSSAKYRGKIQINNEIVYIEYEQIIYLGDQAFFDDIQSVLKAK